MLVVGAGGHSKEILELILESENEENIYFFEDAGFSDRDKIFEKFELLKSIQEVENHFHNDRRFIIAVGKPKNRYKLSERFKAIGGKLTSIISKDAKISKIEVMLGEGLNIMRDVMISPSTSFGEGTLLNARVNVHHDVIIGKYCEISPGAIITGNVIIGDFVTVGSGAIILPGINMGNNAVIGAGAVVNKNVTENTIVVGIPCKEINGV